MTAGRPGRRTAAVVALTAAVVLAGCTGDGPAPAPARSGEAPVAIGPACPSLGRQSTAATTLPDLALPCLGSADAPGAGLPLRRLTGRPTVLNLWASWCAPCREELPALARLHQDGGSRLRVLGVASQDRPGTALSYAADAALPFPSLDDSDGELVRALRRRFLPITVFLAADGAVAEVYQGAPLTDGTLRRLVREKLGVDVG